MWAGPYTLAFLEIYVQSIFMTLIQLTNKHSALLYSGMNTCSGIINTYVKIQHKGNFICGALCQNVAGL